MSDSVGLIQSAETQFDWVNVPPVFIVGCPRSGTTLLRLMLTAHPNISISSEGAYIYTLWPGFQSYGDLGDPTKLRALYQDIHPAVEQEKFLSPPTFEQLFHWVTRCGGDLRSIITFYGTWEAGILGKKELIWWGDNAPYHVFHISLFDSLFPESKFIFMLRDPRDACASSKINLPWHDLDRAIERWEKSLLYALAANLGLGPTRFKIVRYENLVTAPTQQLCDICDFLGIDYKEVMLDFYQSDAGRAIGEQEHHKNLLKPVFLESIGKHRRVLTQEEIDRIESVLFRSMRYLGYLSHEEYEPWSLKRLMEKFEDQSSDE